MNNILSKKFNFWSLIKFTGPTIIMMIIMSLYMMVDGIFVSRLIGTNALSAINIVYPILTIIIALAIMFATGGSAIIANKMGQNKNEEAKQFFSFLVITSIILGLLIIFFGVFFIEPIIRFLGANSDTYQFCYDYAKTLLFFAPLAILQMLFQYFFVTAGKPKVGLFLTLLSGISNILLDYVFIKTFNMGISGAALATGIGFSISGIIGLLYFTFNRKGTLYFIKPKVDFLLLAKCCSNGSSEMVTNLAVAITTFLFNVLTLKYLGSDGVASITIILYSQFLLTALYLGYSSGVAPILSYKYGSNNNTELKKLVRLSLLILTISSLFIYIISILLATNIVQIFAPQNSNVYRIALHGFYLFSSCYLFMGFNIFASALFTSLSNGIISALLSFIRSFVLLVLTLLLLPLLFQADGIWIAVPITEVLSIFISALCFFKFRKKYQYF